MYKVLTYWNGERNTLPELYSWKDARLKAQHIEDTTLEQYGELGATTGQESTEKRRRVVFPTGKSLWICIATLDEIEETESDPQGILLDPALTGFSLHPIFSTEQIQKRNVIYPIGWQMYHPLGVHTLVSTKIPGGWYTHLRNHVNWFSCAPDIPTTLGRWVQAWGLELEELQRSEEPEIFR